jgi:hypothetical protein
MLAPCNATNRVGFFMAKCLKAAMSGHLGFCP